MFMPMSTSMSTSMVSIRGHRLRRRWRCRRRKLPHAGLAAHPSVKAVDERGGRPPHRLPGRTRLAAPSAPLPSMRRFSTSRGSPPPARSHETMVTFLPDNAGEKVSHSRRREVWCCLAIRESQARPHSSSMFSCCFQT